MQDLDVIQRNNAKAIEEASAKAVKEGKFVVNKFTGLHFIDYEAFDNEAERNNAAIEWANSGPGKRSEIKNP